MKNRFMVYLNQAERDALLVMAEQEYRLPADQVRLLVAREAQRRGLLPKMSDCTGTVFQATTDAIATPTL